MESLILNPKEFVFLICFLFTISFWDCHAISLKQWHWKIDGKENFMNNNLNSKSNETKRASVYCSNKKCHVVFGVLDWDKATAVGTFQDSLLSTGWGILDIYAGHSWISGQTDEDVMYAAGYLEGAVTPKEMESQYVNLKSVFPIDETTAKKLNAWFETQSDWMESMIAEHPNDPLWRHASFIDAQRKGLYDGYESVRSSHQQPLLDMYAINFLNANGDLFDILRVLSPDAYSHDWTKFNVDEARNYFYKSGHCSALIKALPGYENVFMSHSSWFAYAATNRIYKHYMLNVTYEKTAAKRISFSSYGGYLESLDDFYHLSSGMVMLQTTNNVFNKSLYVHVKPQSLLAWQRVRIANMMAKSGQQWSDIISKYNSGTYNNQYMVLDLKLIQAEKPFPDNTLWVAEQIPGTVVAKDLTGYLHDGYFPSYNIPVFEEIYNKSGYPEYVKTHGDEYTYQLAPRAKIFRRDQSKVVDLDSMKTIMRYNNYKHDKYSGGTAWGAICSRGDLTSSASADGCYDTKVSDLNMARKFQADIINGPTLGNDLPPFSWTGKFAHVSHEGLPPVYNFSFIRTQPSL